MYKDVDDSLDAVIYPAIFCFAKDESSSAMGKAVAESRYLGDVEYSIVGSLPQTLLAPW